MASTTPHSAPNGEVHATGLRCVAFLYLEANPNIGWDGLPFQWVEHNQTGYPFADTASYLVGVVALQAQRVRTVVTISGQTPVNHPKMYPPKQSIEPQKTFDASTPAVFLGVFLMIANKLQRLLGSFCSFLEAS